MQANHGLNVMHRIELTNVRSSPKKIYDVVQRADYYPFYGVEYGCKLSLVIFL